jgi:TetR/AcrR family transcriptional regulator, copper-responsive repressor
MSMGRPRTFDRDDALQRAVDLFWEHGYDATSVALLSQAMGISTPSLYSAFGDKRTLFLEALDRYLHTFGAFPARALTEEPTAHLAIARLLHDAAVAYTRPDHPRGCLLITAATNCTPQSGDIKAQLRDLRTAGANAVEQKITTAIGAGELPADTDPGALATFYSAVIQGMSAKARDGATREELDDIAAIALRAWPQVRQSAASRQG